MRNPKNTRLPSLFTVAVRNIGRATLKEFVFASEDDPELTPHALLKLELRKRAPAEDFDRCLVILIAKCGVIEQRIVCDAGLVEIGGKDDRQMLLILLPIRLEERDTAVRRAKTSNEEAFEILAIQAGMFGGDAGLLIEEIEFAEVGRPETATRVPHLNRTEHPDPPDTGDYPELTVVVADHCREPAEKDGHERYTESPERAAAPYAHRQLADEIFDGLDFDLFGPHAKAGAR